MKKVLIISSVFVMFFAALGYFIWWQQYGDHNIAQPAQTTSQPLPTASPDTGVVTQPDFNFARLSGDSLHLYSLPIKSDSTLEAAVYKDELDYDYIRLIAKKGNWYQNEDSLWIVQNEINAYFSIETPYGKLSYYDVQAPEDIFKFFDKSAFAPLNVLNYYVYNDSFLSKPPVTLKTKHPIKIINRQLDGYSLDGKQFEIFKIIAFKDTSDSVLGWARSED
ncbi:MAG: hypothetical protein Q7U71_03365, partial [bacterium]|nr:hypothetical protein [bacterium]